MPDPTTPFRLDPAGPFLTLPGVEAGGRSSAVCECGDSSPEHDDVLGHVRPHDGQPPPP